jgi:hypothetical protein
MLKRQYASQRSQYISVLQPSDAGDIPRPHSGHAENGPKVTDVERLLFAVEVIAFDSVRARRGGVL